MVSLAGVSSYARTNRITLTRSGLIGLGILLLTVILLATDKSDFPSSWRYALRDNVNDWSDWVVANFDWLFGPIGDGVSFMLEELEGFLLWLPWPVTVAGVFLLALRIGGLRLALFAAAGFSYMGLVGLWEPSMTTLSLMGVAVLLSVAIGVPLGILASRSDPLWAIMRPILDGMQTVPVFVYLVPVLLLFGIGNTPAIMATMIFAVPPCVRLTNLGIRQVPTEAVEAAQAFGCTPFQTLIKVQLPMAIPSILLGINQTIMLSLVGVVFAGLVGGGGLGRHVVQNIQRLQLGQALEAGLCIVFMAIVFDRISYALSQRDNTSNLPQQRGFMLLPTGLDRFPVAQAVEGGLAILSGALRRISQVFASGLGMLIDSITGALNSRETVGSAQPFFRTHAFLLTSMAILLVILGVHQFLIQYGEFPSPWHFFLKGPVDSIVDWTTVNLAFLTDRIHEYTFLYGLDPIRSFLLWLPWPVTIIGVFLIAWRLAGLHIALIAAGGLVFIGVVGMWDDTMDTLSQVMVTVVLCTAIGAPLGILMARSNLFESIMKPILDTMQTMPGLIFLVPVIMLFGAGTTSGVIAMVIYSIPPVIRLTNLGIRQVSPVAIESAQAYGLTPLQTLYKVQLPLALPSIMMGVNQTVMFAVAMAVYAALIGASGLGQEVLSAVSRADVGTGVEAGLSLLLMAVVLDRVTQGWSRRRQQALGTHV